MTFDVFLCHNSKDKPAVRALGERLRDAGFRPWLDEWELEAGQRFRKELEAQLEKVPAAAVLVGRRSTKRTSAQTTQTSRPTSTTWRCCSRRRIASPRRSLCFAGHWRFLKAAWVLIIL